jgi:hypothetical protein
MDVFKIGNPLDAVILSTARALHTGVRSLSRPPSADEFGMTISILTAERILTR